MKDGAAMQRRPTLVVHAGAWAVPDDEVADHERGLDDGLREGWAALASGGSALDAVVAAVRALEDYPGINAGTGGSLDAEGFVTADAAVVDGERRVGAVTAVRRILNPIVVARRVLDAPEVILTGAGAERFAVESGIALCEPEALITARQRRRLRELGATSTPAAGDTVGAVAIDGTGALAAATSTGGPPGKRVGRVGDSAIAGAGLYADTWRACSSTGVGEAIIRVGLAARVCRRDTDVDAAARLAVAELATVGGDGGCIALDTEGRAVVAFSSPRMAYGWRVGGEAPFRVVANRDGHAVRVCVAGPSTRARG